MINYWFDDDDDDEANVYLLFAGIFGKLSNFLNNYKFYKVIYYLNSQIIVFV